MAGTGPGRACPRILVHAQHYRLLRRVVAEADGIDGLLDEQPMRGQRETVTQV
jgi:hypothetical protein